MQAPALPLSRSPIRRFAHWLTHLLAERVFVLALLLTIPALLPLTAPGYFFGAHDGRHTVFWLLEFDIHRFTSWLTHLLAERAFVLALLLAIPALLPLAAPGYFFGAHDGRHTVFWLLKFDRAFSDGGALADLGARSCAGLRLSPLAGVCAALILRSRSVSPAGIRASRRRSRLRGRFGSSWAQWGCSA